MLHQATDEVKIALPVLHDTVVAAIRGVQIATKVAESELSGDEREIIAGLIATGVYGETEGEAIRAAFMRWCNTNLTRVRRPLMKLA